MDATQKIKITLKITSNNIWKYALRRWNEFNIIANRTIAKRKGIAQDVRTI